MYLLLWVALFQVHQVVRPVVHNVAVPAPVHVAAPVPIIERSVTVDAASPAAVQTFSARTVPILQQSIAAAPTARGVQVFSGSPTPSAPSYISHSMVPAQVNATWVYRI